MKKIVSLLLVVGMLCAMMVSVSAMNNDGSFYFTSDVTEVTVGDTFTVKVAFKGDTDSAVTLKGGKVVVSATSNASFDSAVVGEAVSAYGTQNLSTSTGALGISDTAGVSGDGDYAVLTFTALEAGTFTISSTTVNVQFFIAGTTNKYSYRTALAPLNITIKDAAPADPTVYGDAAVCADTWTAAKSEESANTNTYTNVAVATGSFVAPATEAGFIFAKDAAPEKTGAKEPAALDTDVLTGEGNVEYTIVMYGVDYSAVEAIYAMPYYVPAN